MFRWLFPTVTACTGWVLCSSLCQKENENWETFPMVSTWKTEYDAWMVRYGQCTRTICYHINMANMKGLLVFFWNQLVWGEWIFCFSNSNGPASKINNNMKSKINFFLFYWLCQYLHNQKTPKWNKTKSWDDVTLLQYFFFLCESYHMLF